MPLSIFEKVIDLLDSSRIKYTIVEHAAVETSEDAAKVRGVDLKTGAKSMVVKSDNEYFLFVLPGNKKINWKKAKEILQVKDLSLASIEEAESITGCKRGSVPPFGNVLNLKTVFDQKLLENEYVNFSPGSMTCSMQMKTQDLVALVKPKMVSITDAD